MSRRFGQGVPGPAGPAGPGATAPLVLVGASDTVQLSVQADVFGQTSPLQTWLSDVGATLAAVSSTGAITCPSVDVQTAAAFPIGATATEIDIGNTTAGSNACTKILASLHNDSSTLQVQWNGTVGVQAQHTSATGAGLMIGVNDGTPVLFCQHSGHTEAAIYFGTGALTPTTTNWSIKSDGSSELVINAPSGGGTYLEYNGTQVIGAVVLNGFQFFNSGISAFGSGVGVIGVGNVTTTPTTNPSGGGILYASAGAAVWRGSSGTTTTLAPA